MDYISISPFMRPISCIQLHGKPAEPSVPSSVKPHNKWELFRELSKAKEAFSLSERDLTVLQGLLSFFPGDTLGDGSEMIVFPSNRAICERLNGMADSTMRRHLANLIAAGFIGRRDSPNGKRYSRNSTLSRITFGLDLSPLPQRADEIRNAASEARAAAEHIKITRETISLMRRDLIALARHGAETEPKLKIWSILDDLTIEIARRWRRKLALSELIGLKQRLANLLDQVKQVLLRTQTMELNSSAAQNERHYHNTNKDSFESEDTSENAEMRSTQGGQETEDAVLSNSPDEPHTRAPDISLSLVTDSCPTLTTLHAEPIRGWDQLYMAAANLRSAIGINRSVWEEAIRCMGPIQASVTLAAMLERFDEIRNPGGYLRSLSAKARLGRFSCVPMVLALNGKRQAA